MITRTRQWARESVERPAFQTLVTGLIVFNAITLGLETSPTVMSAAGGLLHAVDRTVLAVFVVEIGLRLVAYGWRFWRDPWNVFDFVIVAISLVPASGPLSVLRVLRVLRLISVVPSMRRVVAGLLAAVPGMVVSAMEGQVLEEAAELHEEEQIANREILAEIRELLAEIAGMRAGAPS